MFSKEFLGEVDVALSNISFKTKSEAIFRLMRQEGRTVDEIIHLKQIINSFYTMFREKHFGSPDTEHLSALLTKNNELLDAAVKKYQFSTSPYARADAAFHNGIKSILTDLIEKSYGN